MKVILLLCLITILLPFRSYSQCDQIEYNKDKFTDVESWKTPSYFETAKKAKWDSHILVIGNRVVAPIIFFYTKDTNNYQISITLYGDQSSFDSKGLYLVFDNGQKLQYPFMEIGSDYMGDRLTFVSVVKLTESETNLFKTASVTDIRMKATDTVIEPWIGNKMKEQFNCLQTKIR